MNILYIVQIYISVVNTCRVLWHTRITIFENLDIFLFCYTNYRYIGIWIDMLLAQKNDVSTEFFNTLPISFDRI